MKCEWDTLFVNGRLAHDNVIHKLSSWYMKQFERIDILCLRTGEIWCACDVFPGLIIISVYQAQ